jgi:LPS sulfotransferase NodH
VDCATVADDLRIVVAAHARSGSNTLVEVLDATPGVTILNEPFNERFPEWAPDATTYLDRVHDTSSLDAVMDEIFAAYTGIKLLHYQLAVPLRTSLLLRPDVHVVTLRRRNLLEAAVSQMIAMQTDYWKREVATGPIDDRYRGLEPVPLESVVEMMSWFERDVVEAAAIVEQRTDGRVLELVYEDLHLAPPPEQDRVLDRLWSFLGVEPPDDATRIRRVLDPGEVQQAGSSTYGQLPNLREIEAELGSDERGHLSYLRA